jgi:type IV pilus assembly protein PilA
MARLRLQDEFGFSIIELTVVILIIAVLVAIAIPTFIGMRGRAHDTAAKQSAVLAVRSGLGVAEGELFEGVTTAGLNTAEPSLTFVDGGNPSTSFTVVSQVLPASDIFVAAVRSTSGTCFMIRHQDAGSDFANAAVPTCKAEDHALMAFGPSW